MLLTLQRSSVQRFGVKMKIGTFNKSDISNQTSPFVMLSIIITKLIIYEVFKLQMLIKEDINFNKP